MGDLPRIILQKMHAAAIAVLNVVSGTGMVCYLVGGQAGVEDDGRAELWLKWGVG